MLVASHMNGKEKRIMIQFRISPVPSELIQLIKQKDKFKKIEPLKNCIHAGERNTHCSS